MIGSQFIVQQPNSSRKKNQAEAGTQYFAQHRFPSEYGFYDGRYGDKYEELNRLFIYAEILPPLARSSFGLIKMGSGAVKQIGSFHDGLSEGRVRMYRKAHIGCIGAHFNGQNTFRNHFART